MILRVFGYIIHGGEEMKVSVIIATKNREYELKKCIESILTQTHKVYEIIVVDASTNDNVLKYVKSLKFRYPEIMFKYIKQTFGGLPTARNLALDIISKDSEIVLFLDDDVILDSGYICNLIKSYEEHKEVGGMAGVSHEQKPYGPLYKLVYFYKILFFMDSPKRGKLLRSGFPSSVPEIRTYVDFLPGRDMSFRRKYIKDMYFDSNLESYPVAIWEDVDFSFRVSRRTRLMINPSLKLEHLKTPKERLNYFQLHSGVIQNQYVLFKKYITPTIPNILAYFWSLVGLVLGSIILAILFPTPENVERLKGTLDGIKKLVRIWKYENKDCSRRLVDR